MKIDQTLKLTNGNDIVLGQKIRVTDPCYGMKTWCAGTIENAKAGTYKTIMREFDEDNWGVRVGTVEIWHESVEPDYDNLTETTIHVGVDSGQAGFADYDYYAAIWNNNEHEDFYYDKCKTFGYVDVPLTEEELEKLEKLEALKGPHVDTLIQHLENPEDKSLEEKLNDSLKQCREIEQALADTHGIYYPTTAYMNRAKSQFTHFISTPDNRSVFTSSGYGDGSYTCYVATDENEQVVGAVIDFLCLLSDEE